MYIEEEKRRHPRFSTFLSVAYSDGDRLFKEFAHNVSQGGLLIKSIDPCQVGMLLDMSIDAHIPIKAKGQVAWVNRDEHLYNIGIQFKDMDEHTTTHWTNFLDHLAKVTIH